MTECENTVGHWKRIANERLRILWIIAHANGGRYGVGKSAQEAYPGDDVAQVWTHTDPQFGDFVIEARRTAQTAIARSARQDTTS